MLTDRSGTHEDTSLHKEVVQAMKKFRSLTAARKFCEFALAQFVAKPDNGFNLSPRGEREGNSAL